jgi:hypothetical protein
MPNVVILNVIAPNMAMKVKIESAERERDTKTSTEKYNK